MEDKNSNVDNLIGHAKEYLETRLDLAKLDAAEKASKAASAVTVASVLAFIGLFVLFFFSAGCAWLIAKATNNTAIGLFSVAGFYFLVGLIFYAFRDKWVKEPIINSILKHFADDKAAKNN